jgi:preprotein translocase subunit SecF
MATHKPFRELVKPGSNFEFVGRSRIWGILSGLLIFCSIGMLFVNKEVRGDYLNWTIDFKGGTEFIVEFCDPKTGNHFDEVGAGDVRAALSRAGFDGFEVSDFAWEGTAKCGKDDATAETDQGGSKTVHGMLLRTPDFGALTDQQQDRIADAFRTEMQAACTKAGGTEEDCTLSTVSWSGDRLFARSTKPLDEQAVRDFFAARELEVKPGTVGFLAKQEQGYDETNTEIAIFGLDKQFTSAINESLAERGAVARIVQSYGVGAKAGEQLRNDGIKSLFYAMALIVLYLAFRFDIRYAPGAVIALLHDAILVTGVFALTWTDVSLTSVAALLTVIGYSVNDTVVIFDRIRENIGRLKDKKLERIVNISLNETLARTLLTSITLFVVTIMMNIFATGLVRNFAFAMNVGVVVGVYSSVFIASPIFLWIDRRFYPSKGPAKGSKKGGSKGKTSGRKKGASKKKSSGSSDKKSSDE